MAAADKIERYLRNRKTPQSSKQIADYFMYSRSTVRRALNELEQAGKIAHTQHNTWYARPVAVPDLAPSIVVEPVVEPVIEPDEPVRPPRPVRNLWPAEPVPDDFLEPVQPPDPRRGTYNRPMVNSYPHARGYDD